MTPFDFGSPLTWTRIALACVWLVFGVVFKALGAIPRHRHIVVRVVGDRFARPVLLTVAAGEATIGLWLIYGRALPLCAGVQTVAIVTMNAIELTRARDLLLTPVGMVCANCLLLAVAWYVALSV